MPSAGQSSQPPLQLAYAAPPPFWRRRRVLRWVIALACIAALLMGAIGLLCHKDRILASYRQRQARRQALALWQRCLALSAPPDQVVYEEDPVRIQSLLLDPASYVSLPHHPHPPLARRWPTDELVLRKAASSFRNTCQDEATLYSREWREPRGLGPSRLLVVSLEHTRSGVKDSQNVWSFSVKLFSLAADGRFGCGDWRPVELLVPIDLNDASARVRFYAGQPDPADSSHFTIRYAVNEQEGILDGWLPVAAKPLLRVRTGPATRPAR